MHATQIGEVCQRWNRQFREPVGMYLSAFHHRGRFRDVLRNWPTHSAQIIVITDGSRVLGLGDLGTNGVAISIGKVGHARDGWVGVGLERMWRAQLAVFGQGHGTGPCSCARQDAIPTPDTDGGADPGT